MNPLKKAIGDKRQSLVIKIDVVPSHDGGLNVAQNAGDVNDVDEDDGSDLAPEMEGKEQLPGDDLENQEIEPQGDGQLSNQDEASNHQDLINQIAGGMDAHDVNPGKTKTSLEEKFRSGLKTASNKIMPGKKSMDMNNKHFGKKV